MSCRVEIAGVSFERNFVRKMVSGWENGKHVA